MQLQDSTVRYGALSRGFHWVMALLFVWMLTSALAHAYWKDSALDAFMWPTHKATGLLIFILALLRVSWALLQRAKRPPSRSVGATLGHVALYGFMLFIPGVALLRQYGSGRPFEAFGVTVMPGFSADRITWMVDLGGAFHSNSAWLFFVLLIGHIVLSFWHSKNRQTAVMPRMWR